MGLIGQTYSLIIKILPRIRIDSVSNEKFNWIPAVHFAERILGTFVVVYDQEPFVAGTNTEI